jgi:hypothetical protein
MHPLTCPVIPFDFHFTDTPVTTPVEVNVPHGTNAVRLTFSWNLAGSANHMMFFDVCYTNVIDRDFTFPSKCWNMSMTYANSSTTDSGSLASQGGRNVAFWVGSDPTGDPITGGGDQMWGIYPDPNTRVVPAGDRAYTTGYARITQDTRSNYATSKFIPFKIREAAA